MTREELIELLKQPELWERKLSSVFTDAIQLKDGSLSFYAVQSANSVFDAELVNVYYTRRSSPTYQQEFDEIKQLSDAVYAHVLARTDAST